MLRPPGVTSVISGEAAAQTFRLQDGHKDHLTVGIPPFQGSLLTLIQPDLRGNMSYLRLH